MESKHAKLNRKIQDILDCIQWTREFETSDFFGIGTAAGSLKMSLRNVGGWWSPEICWVETKAFVSIVRNIIATWENRKVEPGDRTTMHHLCDASQLLEARSRRVGKATGSGVMAGPVTRNLLNDVLKWAQERECPDVFKCANQ